jgi:4-amino-4-deoxy-L-arabinose transferase-like glycosyltransferase
MTNLLKNKQVFGIVLTCLITFFVNNRLIAPDIMECRNLVTAREMVYDNHWIVTTMNGDLRLEKPPLPTWLTAVAEILSPDDLSLQRAMAGLAAVLLVFYFYLFAERVLRINPWVPTLLLCTCYNVILMGRTASWDIYCHAFMMAGIYHFAMGYRVRQHFLHHFMLAGIWTALSILSKGPVSLYALFLPFLCSLSVLRDGTLRGKVRPIIIMCILALVLGGAWYAYIHWAESDALTRVAQKESGSWLNRNVRPWYYYWKFFLEAGVWALLLLTATLYPLFNKRTRDRKSYRFAWQWMLLSLLFLSLLPEKKSRYLLPILIPACLMMGALLEGWLLQFAQSRWARRIFRLNAGLLTLVVALLPVAAWLFLYKENSIGWGMLLLCTLVAESVAVGLYLAAKHLQPHLMVLAVTVLFLFAECAVLPATENLINYTQDNSIALTRDMPELKDIPFYHNEKDPLRIELVYAAHRRIRPLDISSADSVTAHLPCVILTHTPLEKEVPGELLELVDVRYIGEFDDNHRPKDNRRYSDIFKYHVTVLYPKGTISHR